MEQIANKTDYLAILRALLFLIFIPASQNFWSQGKPFAPDKMETILYGVAFYPEYMPYDRLDTDVDLMQRAGSTVVRVGESTWSSWEPRDGESQFAWKQPGHTGTG